MLKVITKLAAGLSSGGIFSIIDGALTLANALINMQKERGLIRQGEKNMVAKHTLAILSSIEAARQVEEEIDSMSDDQIMEELQKDFRD